MLTLAVFALAAGGPAWADPPGRVGRIAETDGNVWLFDAEQGEWVQAQRNRPLTDRRPPLHRRGARAELADRLDTLRLDGGTELEFARLDDDRSTCAAQRQRRRCACAAAQTVREFELVTARRPLRTAAPRPLPRRPSTTAAACGETLAGAMRFEAQDSALTIGAGQRAEFWQEGGVTHYAWANRSDDASATGSRARTATTRASATATSRPR